MKFILGSGSPRRREILMSVFGEVEIIPPHVDESIIPGEKPLDYAMRIVDVKMDAVSESFSGEALILTADTIVSIDGLILGKPQSRGEAFDMLRRLSGKEHSVITGLCLGHVSKGTAVRSAACDITRVRFKELNDDNINDYLGLVHYMDKAGSYALQEYGEMIIDSVTGSVTNVIGLPLGLLFRMLGNGGYISYFF